MVCQKLCQNNGSGRGSLEESNRCFSFLLSLQLANSRWFEVCISGQEMSGTWLMDQKGEVVPSEGHACLELLHWVVSSARKKVEVHKFAFAAPGKHSMGQFSSNSRISSGVSNHSHSMSALGRTPLLRGLSRICFRTSCFQLELALSLTLQISTTDCTSNLV